MNRLVRTRNCACFAAALTVLASAAAGGQQPAAPRPAFDVASVKPAASGRRSRGTSNGSLTARNESLLNLIVWAYGVGRFQVAGPEWMSQATYDILAKAEGPAPEAQLKLMLQTLLAERLHLAFHHETRQLQLSVMSVGKNGPRLQPSEGDGPLEMRNEKGMAAFQRATMGDLAAFLSGTGPSTYDMTGIEGRYDILLDFRRYLDPSDSTMAAFSNAFHEAAETQLGLRFASRKVPVDVLVIDRAEKLPPDN